MKRLLGLMMMVFVASMFTAACGGDEVKAPTYPACETDDHCSDKGEFCVDGQCRECGKTDQCKDGLFCVKNACKECGKKAHCESTRGPCLACKGNKCVGVTNCCTTTKDCPEGQKCKAKPGKKEGKCGTL